MSKILTARQTAEILGYSVGHVTSHLLQTGKIKARKVDGTWVVDRASVEAYVRPEVNKPTVHRKTFVSGQNDTEANAEALRAKIEAVRAGKIKPIVLGRGVREL
jgi:hypothetical protein